MATQPVLVWENVSVCVHIPTEPHVLIYYNLSGCSLNCRRRSESKMSRKWNYNEES